MATQSLNTPTTFVPERPAQSAGSSEIVDAKVHRLQTPIFYSEGLSRLDELVDKYHEDLRRGAERIARLHQSDSVSPAYVDQASEYLASWKPARWQRVVGGIGGIIFGVGLAAAGAMIQSGQYSTRGFVLSIICIVFGMPAFMFHIMKE